MKTIKIYLAPHIEKVHEERTNSEGIAFVSKRYVTVPSKKNQQQAIVSKSTGKPFVKQSEQYVNWKKLVYPIFREEASRIFAINGSNKIIRAKIKIIFYFPNSLPRDLTNKSESIMDALVESGIIFDDMFQVCNDAHLKGFICRDRPRTEIYIHIIEPGSDEFEIDKTDYEKVKKKKSLLRKQISDWCKT